MAKFLQETIAESVKASKEGTSAVEEFTEIFRQVFEWARFISRPIEWWHDEFF